LSPRTRRHWRSAELLDLAAEGKKPTAVRLIDVGDDD
jgi:hypothetical protein